MTAHNGGMHVSIIVFMDKLLNWKILLFLIAICLKYSSMEFELDECHIWHITIYYDKEQRKKKKHNQWFAKLLICLLSGLTLALHM